MADLEPYAIEADLFRLAGALTELEYAAQTAWIDEDTGNPSDAGLERVLMLAQRTTHLIGGLDDEALPKGSGRALSRLSRNVDRFCSRFCKQWLGRPREEAIRATADVDSESWYDRASYLLARSPLRRRAWRVVKDRADALWHVLAADLPRRACFDAGKRLTSGLFRIIPTKAHDDHDSTHDLAYFAVHFNDDLQHAMAALADALPFLRGLDADLSRESVQGAYRKVEGLRDEIVRRLLTPPRLPGYLGLVLDERRGKVRRGEQAADLNGPIRWKLLRFLERSRDEYCPRVALVKAWTPVGRAPTPSADDNRLDSALRELKTKLEPLGVTLGLKRRVGYRLEELPPPKKEPPMQGKQKQKKRRDDMGRRGRSAT